MGWPDDGVRVYTWATKPTASSYIGTVFISDIGDGTYWVSNGTKWFPISGEAVIYTNPTDYTVTLANTDTSATITNSDILFTIPVEGQVFNDLDTLYLTMDTSRSLATPAVGWKIYFSSTAGTLGTPLSIDVSIGNLRYFGEFKLQRLSSTSLRLIGSSNGIEPSSGSGVSLAAHTITGLPSMDSKFYIQVCPYHVGTGASVDETFHYTTLTIKTKV